MNEIKEFVDCETLKVNISLGPDIREIDISLGSDLNFSDRVTSICQWIFFSVVCQFIALFGIATNIINIICFVKQGFKDPVNVSLFGLALADLGCLITLVWTNICYTPAFNALDLPFEPIDVQYLISGMPHTILTRITGWITAVITLERCLCITSPLKVRNYVTSNRVTILIVIISLLLLSSAAPVYIVNRLGMKYYQSRNKTILGLIFMDDRVSVETISFTINNVLIPFGAVSVLIICTIKLVTKLHQLTKWRKLSTSSAQSNNVSTRNRKVAKMVVMISTLFITCFVPISLMYVAAVLEPEFSVGGKYRNAVTVFASVCFVLEAINSSVNTFIYYQMSSKYRDILNGMCWRLSTKNYNNDE